MSENTKNTVPLILDPPDRKSDGYLKRAKQGMIFRKEFNSDTPDPMVIDEMADFLSDYVVLKPDLTDDEREQLGDNLNGYPETRAQAIDTLWMANEETIDYLLGEITGTKMDGTQPEEDNIPKSKRGS